MHEFQLVLEHVVYHNCTSFQPIQECRCLQTCNYVDELIFLCTVLETLV